MLTTEMINAAAAECICQSGPRKGLFKKTCPPMGTLAAAYWQGAMMVLNPHKVSIGQIIFFTPEQHELYDAVVAEMDKIKARRKAA